jgi:hypothetical protein
MSVVTEKSSAVPTLSNGKGTGVVAQSNHIVGFDGPEDSMDPMNWKFSKKVVTSGLYSLTSLGSVWASTASDDPIPHWCCVLTLDL